MLCSCSDAVFSKLGNGDFIGTKSPVCVNSVSKCPIKKITAGSTFSLALTCMYWWGVIVMVMETEMGCVLMCLLFSFGERLHMGLKQIWSSKSFNTIIIINVTMISSYYQHITQPDHCHHTTITCSAIIMPSHHHHRSWVMVTLLIGCGPLCWKHSKENTSWTLLLVISTWWLSLVWWWCWRWWHGGDICDADGSVIEMVTCICAQIVGLCIAGVAVAMVRCDTHQHIPSENLTAYRSSCTMHHSIIMMACVQDNWGMVHQRVECWTPHWPLVSSWAQL